METNKGGDWLEAIAISNYGTMWLAHGGQVIDHMTRNKRKGETRLAGRILYAQARGVTHSEAWGRIWVRSEEEGWRFRRTIS
jgi:hypothetical protein